MPTANTEQHARAELRVTAEERLNRGSAPATRGGSTGAPALASLHRLANAPASASDALKLLHELQVHQVELDLQHEQAEQKVTEHLAEDGAGSPAQLTIFTPLSQRILDRLKEADLDRLTPIEALNLLHELKKQVD